MSDTDIAKDAPDRWSKMQAESDRQLQLLEQASARIDELMQQLEGVDMPIGLSDFLDEVEKELGDGNL